MIVPDRPRTMDDEARELLDRIDDSAPAMDGLFGGLLDISRFDAGVVEVNRGPVAVQPLPERVCRDFEVLANARGLELVLHGCSMSVMSDALLLERIVRNIIGNAVSYTDRGQSPDGDSVARASFADVAGPPAQLGCAALG
jgi:two-component system, sensor histidine kinase